MAYEPYQLLLRGKSISIDQLAEAFPAMFGGKSPEKVTTVHGAYRLVPWIFRAVSISANAMITVPYHVYRGTRETPIDWPFERTSEEWFHWRSDAAQNMWGAAFWQIRWSEKELRWLNPTTMEVEADPKRGITAFVQKMQGVETGRWPPEEILYLPRFHPLQDFGPGIAPVEVALRDTGLSYNITEYASQFFAHGAIPAVLLKSEAPLREQEQERMRTQWQRLYGSIKNAWRTAVLGRGIEPVVIGHAINDLAMPDLNEQATKNVAAAFEMSVTFLRGEAANYATAEQETVKYYISTVQPKCLLRASQMNLQLWSPVNMRGEYDIKAVEPIQQYEAEKAAGYADLMERVEAGHTAGILGRKRAVYLIEELWAGLGYDKIKEIEDEEPEPEPAPIIQQIAPEGGPPSANNNDRQQQEASQRAHKQFVLDELRSWRRYLKNRGVKSRPFIVHSIPEQRAIPLAYLISKMEADEDAIKLIDDMIHHEENGGPDPLEGLSVYEKFAEDTLVRIPDPGDPIDVAALIEPATQAWDRDMPEEAREILNADVE